MKLKALPQYAVLPAKVRTEFHVLIRLEAKEAEEERLSINLALVLDCSGSMREGKIAATKDAAKLLVDRLGKKDTLSIVLYGTDVKTLLKPTAVTDREKLKRVVDDITTGGTTNLSGGWLMGLRHAGRGHRRNTVTRVVLMTDGLANRGITDILKLEGIAETHRRKGLITSTMGFGEGFREEMLTRIAQAGGGNFHYIRYPDDVPQAFVDELGDALSVAAQNVVFSLTPKPGFFVTEVVSTLPHNRDGDNLEVFGGDVFAGEGKNLLVKMQANPTLEGKSWLLRVRTECDLVSEGHDTGVFEAVVEAVFRENPSAVLPDATVVLELGLMRSARVRRRAISLADDGDFREAERILLQCAKELDAERICREDLAGEIREIRKFAEAFGRRQWSGDERKSLSASVFLSQAGRLMNRRDKLIDTRVDEEA
jgi:Ca-activated chloride channel family protein